MKIQTYDHNVKHMIALTQITNTENFAFIAVLVFLGYRTVKVLFKSRKDNTAKL